MTTLARTERAALADLLASVGPDQPTLCGDWTTRDLAAHLAVRERRPDATPGVAVKALAGYTETVQNTYADRPYDELVELVRSGPGRFSPFSLPGADTFFNTTEYAIHHEDVRRAAPGWEPRDLPPRVQDTLWKALASRSPISFRGLACGVELHRTDQPRAKPLVPATGDSTVTLSGEPMELLLYVFGRRDQARVDITGDATAIALLDAFNLEV